MLLCTLGCRHARIEDPSEIYNRAHAELVHGHLIRAEQMSSAARQQFLTANPQWSFRFCLLQADALAWSGRSQDVVSVLQAGDRGFTPNGDLLIKQQLLLSLALARVGQKQRSDEQLAHAREGTQASSSMMRAEVYRTIGLTARRQGNLDEATQWLQKTLELARQQGDLFLESAALLNMGTVALQGQHIDEALDSFHAAARTAEAIHAEIVNESSLGNAGWAYYALGDFERALGSFQQAQTQARELGSFDNEILWTESAGLCLYRLGDLQGARSNYELALKRARQTGLEARVAETQTSLGLLYLQVGQLDAAQKYADEALHGARGMGDAANELDALFLQALIAARQSSVAAAEIALKRVYGTAAKLPSLRWQVENAYASMYSRNNRPQQADAWFQRSIQTFEEQRASLHSVNSRLPFFANGDVLYRDYAEFLIRTGRSDDALLLLDHGRARTLEDGLGPVHATGERARVDQPKRVASKLNGTILFYSLGPEISHLWLITAEGTRLFNLPPEAEIVRHVKSYQASLLKSADALRESNADGQWLYQTLVSPSDSAKHTSSRVFLVRSGELNKLNFETLLKPSDQKLHYWIEDACITSVSSIWLLARATTRNNGGKLLLIGDPSPASADYPPLANAGGEVASITKYFDLQHRTIFTQGDAVPSAYAQSNPQQFAYIHFVAHGTASSQQPLDSAVVLSAPPSQPDSFKLYARDIVQQPIGANLVTVSACYGSGSRDYVGEGLVGLAWSFLRAGAHNVIGATWAVDDASTAQLMDGLYQGLAHHQEPSEALRQAKLSLMRSVGVYRKPFYWAGFQLYAGS